MSNDMRNLRNIMEAAEDRKTGTNDGDFGLLRSLSKITESVRKTVSPEDRDFFLDRRNKLSAACDAALAAYHEQSDRANIQALYAARNELGAFDNMYDLTQRSTETMAAEVSDDYKGQHTAPMNDSGSPLWNLCLNETYPEDFYHGQARHYTDGTDAGYNMVGLIMSMHNRPNAPVKMYRSIPKNLPRKINVGDWVTLSRRYAVDHGRMHLNNDYIIVSKTVFARDVFTAGDSLDEWGYDPQTRVKRASKTSVED